MAGAKKRKKYKLSNKPNPGQMYDKPQDERICLKCRKAFMSFGIFNRICGSCKETKEYRGASLQAETGLLPK